MLKHITNYLVLYYCKITPFNRSLRVNIITQYVKRVSPVLINVFTYRNYVETSTKVSRKHHFVNLSYTWKLPSKTIWGYFVLGFFFEVFWFINFVTQFQISLMRCTYWEFIGNSQIILILLFINIQYDYGDIEFLKGMNKPLLSSPKVNF